MIISQNNGDSPGAVWISNLCSRLFQVIYGHRVFSYKCFQAKKKMLLVTAPRGTRFFSQQVKGRSDHWTPASPSSETSAPAPPWQGEISCQPRMPLNASSLEPSFPTLRDTGSCPALVQGVTRSSSPGCPLQSSNSLEVLGHQVGSAV